MAESVVVSEKQRVWEAALEVPSEALVGALRELQYVLYHQARSYAGPEPPPSEERAHASWLERVKAFQLMATHVLYEHVGGGP